MRNYKFYLLSYRPSLTSGEQLVIGLVFQVENEKAFLVMPDSSPRLQAVWKGLDVPKYKSLSGMVADALRARLEGASDISTDLESFKGSGGSFIFSSLMLGRHPEPVERLSDLIDEFILKNL